MRYAYAVTQAETFSAVVRDAQPLIASLTSYARWLETLGTVQEPRGIVFHDLASATTVFSEYVLAFFIEALGISRNDQEALWLVERTSS